MKKLMLILLFFVLLFSLYSQETLENKSKYKFVFVFNDMECTGCYVSCIKKNIENIQNQFKDINECYIIMQVRKNGDASIYRNHIKDATIIETTEKLDFSNCGVTKFPGLICYNEYGIPVKIYNNITQSPPMLHNRFFEIMCPKLINKFKSISMVKNDSINYISFAPNSIIFNDKIYCVDELSFRLNEININTGILESSFNLNDTTISNALLEDKYRIEKNSQYINEPSVLKVYGFFGANDRMFIMVNSIKKIIERGKKYIEEYDDSVNIIEDVQGILLISMDTNYNYTFKEFSSKKIYSNTKHNFSWDFYIKNNYLLFPLFPDNKDIDSSVYLLVKYDMNKNKDSINYELICPYIIKEQTTFSDYAYTQKIIDNNYNVFVVNADLNVFSRINIEEGNQADLSLQGSYALNNYSFNDTNINNIINEKKYNIHSLFLDELNDSLIITGFVYNDKITHDAKGLCLQTYNKYGKFIKEKTYNLEGISKINYSCIYNNNLVFMYRKDGVYNLVFIPIDEKDPEERRAIYPIEPMNSCPTDYGLEMELKRIEKENQKNKIKEQ